ncbi:MULTISPECIES: DNA repair protein RecN [Thiorhodovibrio]|uniref:DNA repair protein RecN n=1 Tax=Thiorhodovibrio TaxID=61593 RepID=UPI001914593D|nr:DNA repair protein RecN [Thiorhodovibrio litoralis]MBK5969767.1 DNA repair protein RecN [Thiorhodovibrio winogradskyi]WPL13817.1 Recombination protein N [Thiorhodovibrio litoralis]
MLTEILVHNLVIVSRLELEFGPGMTALTGETGAGKSILIDALGLTLGERADASMIRAGSDKAEVSAHFDLTNCPRARDWLAEQELDDDGECAIRRVLQPSGRSRAFINGRGASGSQLKALGELLVDIHGQHAHQSLLRATAQRELLDGYAAHGDLRQATARHFRHFRDCDERWQRLTAEGEQRADRLELLRFQLNELDDLALSAGELDQLDVDQRRLANQERLQETSARILQLLYDGEPALHDQLGRAGSDLAELSALDGRLAQSVELVEGAAVQIEEAASDLRQYLDALDMDPARLQEIEDRLSRIHEIARKYRVLPAQLPELHQQLKEECDALEQADANLDSLAAERDQARADYLAAAETLSAARRAAAERLAATVTASMQELGMAGGQFAIDIQHQDIASAAAHGLDQISFLVSANPGQPMQPLAKVASGGELSRISLAIQVATANCISIPVLVFDEVDVGIGGGVAEIVGRQLRQLGEERQVLCVTHLPQVAAQAHHQLRVHKQTRDGQTFADINALTADERVEEIARMLGGTDITATTRAHAAEMLARPEKSASNSTDSSAQES